MVAIFGTIFESERRSFVDETIALNALPQPCLFKVRLQNQDVRTVLTAKPFQIK